MTHEYISYNNYIIFDIYQREIMSNNLTITRNNAHQSKYYSPDTCETLEELQGLYHGTRTDLPNTHHDDYEYKEAKSLYNTAVNKLDAMWEQATGGKQKTFISLPLTHEQAESYNIPNDTKLIYCASGMHSAVYTFFTSAYINSISYDDGTSEYIQRNPDIKQYMKVQVVRNISYNNRDNVCMNEKSREIALSIRHNNIMRILSYNTGWFDAEYAGAPALTINTPTFDSFLFEERMDILYQLVTGIDFLHSQGLEHGDLHTNNFLINKYGRVRIIDFGEATLLSESDNPPDILDGMYITRIAIDNGLLEDTPDVPSYHTTQEILLLIKKKKASLNISKHH